LGKQEDGGQKPEKREGGRGGARKKVMREKLRAGRAIRKAKRGERK